MNFVEIIFDNMVQATGGNIVLLAIMFLVVLTVTAWAAKVDLGSGLIIGIVAIGVMASMFSMFVPFYYLALAAAGGVFGAGIIMVITNKL